MYSRITLEKAREVHRSLKLAAGMFMYVKEHLLPKVSASPEEGVDTDTRVVEAYAQMSQAEAQEVTLAWALELGHKPDVVTSLAQDTSSLFTMAGELIDLTTCYTKNESPVEEYTYCRYICTVVQRVVCLFLFCFFHCSIELQFFRRVRLYT